MPDRLENWPPIEFTLDVLSRHPAPVHPGTGKASWEQGIRLHGTQEAILGDPFRFKQVRGGVRGGKTFVGGTAPYIDYLWKMTQLGRKRGLWWIVGPDYDQCEPEMQHLDRLFTEAGIAHRLATPKNDSWVLSFPHRPGVEIVSKTGRDYTKIAGRAPDGIVIAEAGQCLKEVWEACLERVTETSGWVLMEGTFEGSSPWYYEMAEEWTKPGAIGRSYPLPTWANTLIFPGGRDDPAIKAPEAIFPPAKFLERYGGEPTKPTNLVLPEARDKFHVKRRYPRFGSSFDPERPVYLAIDPGRAHAYAVLATQCWGNVVWVIDAVYRWGKDTQALIAEVAAKPWAKHVELAVMDVAGEQVSANGESNADQWRQTWPKKTGNGLYIHTQRVPLDVGYDLHKRALLNAWPEDEAAREFNRAGEPRIVTDANGPRLFFDPEGAPPLFGGLVDGQRWQGEYGLHKNPRRRDGSVSRDVPIDENNDAIKALNYFLFWYFTASGKVRYLMPSAGRASTQWRMVLPGA